ncbi:MAG: hypothetical protein AB7K37_03265 [Cyclobacteriaceae bacterium]
MISPLPSKVESYQITHTPKEVSDRLAYVTTDKLLLQNQEVDHFLFTGWVKSDHFRISLKIKRPNSFLPIAKGLIESTSEGCIVLVRYELFPSTKMFLTFWCMFALLVGMYVTFQYKQWIYAASTFLLLVVILWVAWSNFQIQLTETRDALTKVLS